MRLKKNTRERKIQLNALNDGWEVLSKGWPDFMLYKEKTNEVKFIEVKRSKTKNSINNGLSKHQKRMHKIFECLGFAVEILYVD